MEESPKLKVVTKELKGQSFTLSGPKHTIGRTEACDICIPNAAVSSKHCTLERQENGDYLLTDLNSTNGTVVNGKKVSTQQLQHSDIIRIGAVEIIYESPVKQEDEGSSKRKGEEGKKIDVQHTAGSAGIAESRNFSPFSSSSGSQLDRGIGRMPKIIGIGVIIALALVVAIALTYVILELIN